MATVTSATRTRKATGRKSYRKVRVFQLSVNQIAFLMLVMFIFGWYVR